MKKDIFLRIHRILGILTAVSIVAAGICLITGCLSIYGSGEQPYSRQAIADAFGKIAIPIFVCLALTVLGMILEFISPDEKKKEKNIPDNYSLLKKLSSKKQIETDSPAFSEIQKEKNFRKRNLLISLGLLSVASIVFLIYALNINNFHPDEINQSVINAMKWLFPCFLIPFGFGVYTLYANEKSLKREIAVVKELPSAPSKEVSKNKNKNAVKTVRYVFLALALGILVYGFISGGTEDVLTKAVNICTECIGLG